jgi:hypothetical protein
MAYNCSASAGKTPLKFSRISPPIALKKALPPYSLTVTETMGLDYLLVGGMRQFSVILPRYWPVIFLARRFSLSHTEETE